MAFRGRIFAVHLESVSRPDGTLREMEIVRHPGAAGVLPVYGSGGSEAGTGTSVLLLRQYRHAVGGELWEIPAGKLERGESPEDCARRELLEETGLVAGRIEWLTEIFTSPGFTDEGVHLFAAYGLTEGTPEAEREGEILEMRRFRLSEALDMIRGRRIADAKTISALLYVAAFRLSGFPTPDGSDK